MDYEDKLPTRPWYNFAPPRRYILVPPLTGFRNRSRSGRVGQIARGRSAPSQPLLKIRLNTPAVFGGCIPPEAVEGSRTALPNRNLRGPVSQREEPS